MTTVTRDELAARLGLHRSGREGRGSKSAAGTFPRALEYREATA
jgi:hypothetical protein